VYDATGAAIPKASLKLTNDGTGVTQNDTSGSDGGFASGSGAMVATCSVRRG